MILLVLPITLAGSQISEGTNVLEIRIPQRDYIQTGSDVSINIQVFNKSNGLAVGVQAGVDCYLDLYNATGNQFVDRLQFTREDIDYDVDISGTNFTTVGAYSFLLFCNNSNIGGFVSDGFDVTSTGKDEVEDNMPLIIIGAMILLIALYFVVLIRLFSERAFTEHGLIKMMFHLIAFWAILIPLNISVQFLEHYAGPEDVIASIQNLHEIIIYLNYFITIYFMLWFIIQMLKKVSNNGSNLKLSNQ